MTIQLENITIKQTNRLYEIKTYYDFALLTPKTKLKNNKFVINEMKKKHLINPS